MVPKTYLLSRVWAWSLVAEAVAASGFFIWAGWGGGSIPGLAGVPLRLLATLVSTASTILLRLAYVMSRQRELIHLDETGITGREPSSDLWPNAVDFRIPWEQLAAVEVVGGVMQRVQLLDRHARAHTVSLVMVAGLRGSQGRVLADDIRAAHAEWRSRTVE